MTVKALTGLLPEWYTPVSEEDENEKAEFQLKPLTSPQIAKIQGHFDNDTGEISGTGLFEAAAMGVIAWKNVNGQDDKPLRFSRRSLEALPYALLLELGGQIIANSFLTGDDEKNS